MPLRTCIARRRLLELAADQAADLVRCSHGPSKITCGCCHSKEPDSPTLQEMADVCTQAWQMFKGIQTCSVKHTRHSYNSICTITSSSVGCRAWLGCECRPSATMFPGGALNHVTDTPPRMPSSRSSKRLAYLRAAALHGAKMVWDVVNAPFQSQKAENETMHAFKSSVHLAQ